MHKQATIRYSILFIAAASLGTAFILAGHWLILAAVAGMALLWFLLRRWSVFGSTVILLVAYILSAAIGVMIDLSQPLLVLGLVSALASWDLACFESNLAGETRVSTRMERAHLESLALACGLGLILALFTTAVDLKLSFGWIFLLVILALGGLVMGLRYVRRLAAPDL